MPDDAASLNVNVRCTRRRVPGAPNDEDDNDSQEEGVESEQEQDPEVLRQQENQDEIDRDIQHLQEQLQDGRDESIIQDYGEDPGPSQRRQRGTKRTRGGAKARGTGRGRGRGGGRRGASSSAGPGA